MKFKKKGTSTKRGKATKRVRRGKVKPVRKPAKKKRPANRKKASPHKLKRLDSARLEIGQEEGTDKLAETNWLTPTKKGFGTVRKHISDVVKTQRGKRTTLDVFSYNLYVTMTGPNGKPINIRIEGASLPIFEWVKEKTNSATLIETCVNLVRTKIYDNIRIHFDLISPGKAPKGEKKLTEAQARKMLKKIRSGRDTKFKFILFRTAVKPAKRKRKK